jgi:hypothetical protein
MRYAEGDPAGLSSLDDELASGAIRMLPVAEWTPETIAAYERAHLGFLTASPMEVQRGTPRAQVAMHHPEYIRQLVQSAQRPEVRAAAGRLVEALDAASEHKRTPTRGAARRGRSTR